MTPSAKIKLIEEFDNLDIPEKDVSILIDRLLSERMNLVEHFERVFKNRNANEYGDKFTNVSMLLNDELYVKQMLSNLIGNAKVKSIGEVTEALLITEFYNIFTI